MSTMRKHWQLLVGIGVPVVTAGITVTLLLFVIPKTTDVATTTESSVSEPIKKTAETVNTPDVTPTVPGLQLDTTKKYGDKYADGILPVGDNKYSTTGASKGVVYLCHAPNNKEGGAGTRGPWFTNNNTEYDIKKKAAVSGSVKWDSQYSMTVAAGIRTIVTNDLPNSHTTGIFPIKSSDAAYLYDRNPNTISAQSLTYSLPYAPSQLTTPGCVGGEVGIMTTGVALFDGFDAGGRDAGAWEVQDSCGGHPQKEGEYHYHTLSSCITDVNVNKVIGYALDGFPITGPTISTGNVLTTSDLDECHGIVSSIILDGQTVTSYHYVMTQDFPYSVSCFRGTAINAPH